MLNFFKKLLKPKHKSKKYIKRTKEEQWAYFCERVRGLNLVYLKSNSPNDVTGALHFGKKEYYKKTEFDALRVCRCYEGIAWEKLGNKEQATNAYMSVLYLDLLGNWDILGKKGSSGSIFPNAYKKAFQENLLMEKFEEIFLFNANNLVETLQFKPPITPQQAWEKIKTYNP